MTRGHEAGTASELPKIGTPTVVSWQQALPSKAFIRSAPILNGGRVAVRCGSVLACLDVNSGAVLWKTTVAVEDLDSRTIAATPQAVITATTASTGKSSIIAMKWEDGSELWNTPVAGEVPDDGITAGGGTAWAITAEKGNSRYSVRQFDAATGKQVVHSAPIAANHPVSTPDGLLFSSKDIFGTASGIYLLRSGSKEPQRVIESKDAYRPSANQKHAAVVIDRVKRKQHEVVVIDLESMRPLWSVASAADTVAIDASEVAFFEASGESRRAVLADAVVGTPIWTTPPLDNEPLTLFFSGDTVCVIEYKGLTFLDRASGKPRGHLDTEWTVSWGAGLDERRLIVGHHNEVRSYTDRP